MGDNRNAQLRYQVIDKCLRNRSRKWTWKTILEKVNEALIADNPNCKGIGKTMLYEDLKDIEYRIYNGPIERTRDGRNVYLRYADSNYSINSHPLTESEVAKLKSALTLLTRFAGLPQFDWITEIILTIEARLGLVRTEKKVVSFDANLDYTGIEFISTLFYGIINETVLKITYQDFKSVLSYDINLHPYHLKQYNYRWYVLGHSSSRPNDIQILALDRIKKIEESSLRYKSISIDWDEYFYDTVGVTRYNQQPVDVRLFIADAEQAAYVQTKPIHRSQKKIKKVDGGYETSIKVTPNYELETLILSFGERIKVLSPKSLKEKLSKRIHKLYEQYIMER